MSTIRPKLWIRAIGAMSPVGHGFDETAASIRAGLSSFGEHPYFTVETADPGWDEPEVALAALVPGVDSTVEGPHRLVELGIFALRDMLKKSKLRRADLAETAFLLALPFADDVVRAWDLPAAYAPVLCQRAGLQPFRTVRVDQSGHVGVLRLLAEADALMSARAAERCILLAADTFHDERRLELYDRQRRIRSARCPDGFIPGEGAVALLVEREPADALAAITVLSEAGESQPFTAELSSSGRGLQAVLEPLLAPGPSWVACDLNGESYRAFEWGLMLARLAPALELARLDHPADCFGEAGAAFGGLLVAHVVQAFARRYAPADRAIVWTAGDGAERFGAVVSRAEP